MLLISIIIIISINNCNAYTLKGSTTTAYLSPTADMKILCETYELKFKIDTKDYFDNNLIIDNQLRYLHDICKQLPPDLSICKVFLLELDLQKNELEQRVWSIISLKNKSAQNQLVNKREVTLKDMTTDRTK